MAREAKFFSSSSGSAVRAFFKVVPIRFSIAIIRFHPMGRQLSAGHKWNDTPARKPIMSASLPSDYS
jgi:hypothetical protein